MLVQQFDVREGEVTTFAFTFALPLAVHIYFGHLHSVAHLGRERRGRHDEYVVDSVGTVVQKPQRKILFTSSTRKTNWIILPGLL